MLFPTEFNFFKISIYKNVSKAGINGLPSPGFTQRLLGTESAEE